MNGSLPPIETPVLLAALDALPARLRKKLDDAAAKLAGRTVTRDGDQHTVAIDDATTVTLTTDGGVVRAPDAVTCTCLLAPNCLHRAAVLSLAPVHDGDAPAEDDEPQDQGNEIAARNEEAPAKDEEISARGNGTPARGDGNPAQDGRGAVRDSGGDVEVAVPEEDAVVLTAQQAAAVAQLWRAAVAVLAGGTTGSGTVTRAALLRAAHEAQACKVYRAAASARVVATLLQAGRGGDANYRLGDLSEALRELLGVVHRLRTWPGGTAAAQPGSARPRGGQPGPGGEELLGSARRQYHLEGSLRLYGLCTTAVLAGTGHAGVVTYAADRRGRLWMVADVMPGDARRAARAGDATIAMGETALTHRRLTRAGLVVSGATAAGTRQLGAGRGVRAVTASGAAWHEEPLAGLWAEPVAAQVHRAFEALAVPVTDRPAGADLLFLRVTLRGRDGDAVLAETPDGLPLSLRVAVEHPALGYRENLRVLGRAEGLELLLIARPDPGRPGTVLPLAVAPPPGAAWHLPAPFDGHADLAFDRLHRSQLPQPDPANDPARGGQDEPAATANDPARDGQDEVTTTARDPARGGQDEPVATAKDAARGGQDEVAGPAESVGGGKDEVTGAAGAVGGGADGGWRPAVHDAALHMLTAQVERAVSGGRVMLTFPNGRGASDAARLRWARLDTGADLLDRLARAAADRPRDAFGRLADDDGTAFAQAWLAAATYADAAGRALAEAAWLPGDPHLEPTG
ncbi:hypothetical protein ABT297_14245 [Dactylosporangium sp. NPDC000555]|uniref:hypothetical protein n=1 Tax=Dactylosporangium sp. NPDC000555 TaxID=3154260 RepID=UPI00331FFB60